MDRLFLSRVLSVAALGLALLGLGVVPSASAQETDIQTADYDVTELTYPDLRDFEVPEPERIELDNGMTVFLLEDPELPQVNASAQIGVGSVYEPAEKRGLASITGTVMRTGGTESMAPDSLNTVLENIAATVETSIGETSGSAYMSTLADHVDTVLPVFAEVLRRPAFAEDRVQQAKSQVQSGITRRNDNASSIVGREFDKVLYGDDSPYARTPELYTVDRIERQDLVDFHDQYVHPNNVILSVWGDFDADQMEQKLRRQFGDWEAPTDFEPPTPPEPDAERAHSVNFVQKSDVNQSNIRMGHPGELTRQSDDYASVQMMNEVLSGGFSGRLFQQVRREKGLAYSVGGVYTAGYNRPGRFYASVASQSASTVEATNAVMTEVKRMRDEPPTQEELGLAKDSYLNSFVFNFDSEREILGRRATYEYYDYPADFLQRTRAAIEEVTPDDVLSAAQTYLHPDESHILIVGNGDQFSKDLSTLSQDGTVDTLDISIPRESPSEEQADMTAAEEEAAMAGQQLMANAKEALGGSAFDQIQNMRVVTEQQGTESTLVVRLPNQLRTEVSTAMGNITVVNDGETMKMKTPQGTRTAPPSARGQIMGQLWRSLPYLMASLDHEGLTVAAEGETTVDGTRYRVADVQPPAGSEYTLYLHAETMRPERLTLEQTNPQTGQQVSVTQTFTDFREVSGVRLPFTTETIQSTGDGENTVTANIQSLDINADLKEGLFTLDSSASGGASQ
ncbi:M16 family metallopeptidase [Salinibacter altiplanensis]|uniref:M16 family metallopeptidase n=1 Tax=Salinibacter altiplanensis TaxID=1803181 RepID=UPI001F451C27|nr:pitrilysin family protein [Salinibacter altiplanensis]